MNKWRAIHIQIHHYDTSLIVLSSREDILHALLSEKITNYCILVIRNI